MRNAIGKKRDIKFADITVSMRIGIVQMVVAVLFRMMIKEKIMHLVHTYEEHHHGGKCNCDNFPEK